MRIPPSKGLRLEESRFSDEQLAHALRESEAGTPIAVITRKLGVSVATFYARNKKFGSMGTAEYSQAADYAKRTVAQAAGRRSELGRDDAPRCHFKMLAPMRRRVALPYLRKAYQISEIRTSHVIVVNRSTVQYTSVKTDVPALRARINEIAVTRVRYGYPRIHILLRPEGWIINRKRV